MTHLFPEQYRIAMLGYEANPRPDIQRVSRHGYAVHLPHYSLVRLHYETNIELMLDFTCKLIS